MRVEIDSLGEKNVPKNVYFGIQTVRAVENFPVSGIKAPRVFIFSYAIVKKAATIANIRVGLIKVREMR